MASTATTSVRAAPAVPEWRRTLRRLRQHRLVLLGSSIIALMVLVGLWGPQLAPHDPELMDFAKLFAAPSWQHPFGTDNFGRDIFSRILYGARVSLQVALIAVLISATLGVFLGAVAGFYGGWLGEVIMRLMDILFAFPAVLLAITVMAILGRGITNAMIAIAVVYTPIFARVTRGAVLSVRGLEYINAARALGQDNRRIIFRHILPNALGPIIVQTSLSLAFAILAEAALSFFGLGTQPPAPSWGRMLSEGRAFLQQAPWMGIFPGLSIMLAVLGFNLLGDGLRDVLDPRLNNALKREG